LSKILAKAKSSLIKDFYHSEKQQQRGCKKLYTYNFTLYT